ncbi:radical SAM protein [Anaerococcus tetradius]|uniref:radical SAM protein n=1 Tax=Anaerococcus tetradius TaxID=33036 RepID=UPI0023EFBFA6|nr:radical SAM protein [Anaerococcus tetradius]
MKKYFNLYSTTFHVKGKDEVALYNTLNGNVISLNMKQSEVLDKLIQGNCIEDLNYEGTNFVYNMVKNKLGFINDNLIKIEKTFFGDNEYFEKIMVDKKKIEIAQIEITNNCNLNCSICDINSDLVYRRTGCKKRYSKNEELTISNWLEIIDKLALLGCKRIEFFGGEPLLEFEKLKALVKAAHKNLIKDIVLYTNGLLIDDEVIRFLNKNNIKCIIQILKLDDNKDILGTTDDFNYLELFKYLESKKVNYELLFLITRYNDFFVNEYISIFKKLNISYSIDFIYPKPNNGYYSEKFKNIIINYRKHIVQCNPYNLGILLTKNPCYYNRIAFSIDGNAYPCIMSRKEIYGNYSSNNNITELITEKFDEYKHLNKEKYVNCCSCSYRYACFTCTAIDISSSNKELKCINCSKAENV